MRKKVNMCNIGPRLHQGLLTAPTGVVTSAPLARTNWMLLCIQFILKQVYIGGQQLHIQEG